MSATVVGQPFGRFGYESPWVIPGINLDKHGFRVDHAAADRFAFPVPLKQWKPLATTETSQTMATGEFAGSPSKLRHDLLAPGVSMYFPQGFRFRLTSTTAPFLTWPEGSLDANTEYATPPAPWVVVSFRDRQPPLLLVFLGDPAGVRLTGKTGEWWITSDASWAGWVRVLAPLGERPFPTLGAADLGRLSQAIQPILPVATQPAASITGFKVTEEGPSLVAEWTFDQPHVVLPTPAYLAPIGGYGLNIGSKTQMLQAPTPHGATLITDEPRLVLRAIARRVPTGRALALGAAQEDALSTASYLDVPSVTELALANLSAHTERAVRELAEQTVGEFLTETPYTPEPTTQQKLPFDASGKGLDLTASHALLFQTTLSTVRATSEPNSLLTSILLRRDWLTWRLWCEDNDRRRRAMALASLAAAISPEPERRWEGVMLHAGLAAERGLAIWRRRLNPQLPEVKHFETLPGLREELFGKDDYRRSPGYGALLASDLRVYGDVGLQLVKVEQGHRLRFRATDTRPISVSLASSFPLEIKPGKGIVSVQVTQAFGVSVVRCVPRDAGECELDVSWPDWAAKLPAWLAPPRYEEVQR
ncbi:MAG: hypothetical protein IT363_01290 [Methanoregulaceae archaeon]|nr:hypothetical protein [Methanoregulaceae archaeon]